MTHPWKTHVSCSPPSRKRSIQRNAGRRNMGTKGPRPPCIEKKKYKLFLGGDLRPSRQARSLVLFLQRAECRDEGFVELPKPSLQNVFSSLGVLELLRAQLVQQTAHALLHDPQREHGLVLPAAHAGTTHGLPCQTMERQHVPEHPHALVKRAELIVRGEAVLLEEVLLEETCRFQGHLIPLCERVFPHQLHELVQLVLLLQYLSCFCAQRDEFRVKALIKGLQGPVVLRIGKQPVHARKVLALCQLLVQPPKHLDDAECCCGYWVRKVSSGWADGADDRHAAFPLRASQTLHLSSSLVETRQTRAQVSWVPAICWHFRQSPADFSKGFRPA
mmetsp:Transcript_9950/g.60837  ORF Transcript_9950/g.60837 Transcript_9950/m.60837 type:complete len:332 (+) Transcript_9950:856-1851(+)